LIKIGQKESPATTTQVRTSKRQEVNQQSAPLAAAVSTPEKAQKPKVVEAEPTLPSPPVSTLAKVKQSKAKPAESVSAVVPPPPPPAEIAQLTSPLAVADNKKEAPAGAAATNSAKVSVNAMVIAVV
jgi:hypothetical protein